MNGRLGAAIVLALAIGAAQAAEPLKMRTLAQGAQSQITKPREVVVRTQAEFNKLWDEHQGGLNVYKVDFKKQMVLAAFLGTRPTTGYLIQIQSAQPEKGKLVVTVLRRKPAPDVITAQVVTQPFHMVVTDRSTLPVVWRSDPDKH